MGWCAWVGMSQVENPVNNGYSLYLGTTVSQLALVYSQSYGIPLAVRWSSN